MLSHLMDLTKFAAAVATTCLAGGLASAEDHAATTNTPAADPAPADSSPAWNWHVQNTDIGDWHPGIPAKYSGPNSLSAASERQETVSLDLLAGARLWPGAEFHADGLMWQGFGFSKTLGIEGFPNAEAYRFGTQYPNVNFTRAFIREVVGLGGASEDVADDPLHLAGKVDENRLTFTVGKFSAKDIFDNNAYANDPRTQFLNWGLVANEPWDYPADSIGFTTGAAAELNVPDWALRYGFFQMPRVSNGLAQDTHYLEAWAMVTELQHDYKLAGHPGSLRLLGYVNRAHMGSYEEAVDNGPAGSADIVATRSYREKFGFGLNLEQEVVTNVGAFLRVGWSNGKTEAWAFSDVDEAVSGGLSIKGAAWHRPDDTLGLAGIVNGISKIHQRFLADGGTGILAGDGALNYGPEEVAETYYDFAIYKTLHGAVDYQFVAHPAFNRDRGPVSVASMRIHWEF